jgi:multidrug resistance efflux pump
LKGISSIFLVLLVSLLLSCTGGTTQRTAELVARDYHAMSDQELQTHYAQISDQLARETRAERMIATGRSSVRSGASGDPEAVSALRERWNQVRQEMRRRDLLP